MTGKKTVDQIIEESYHLINGLRSSTTGSTTDNWHKDKCYRYSLDGTTIPVQTYHKNIPGSDGDVQEYYWCGRTNQFDCEFVTYDALYENLIYNDNKDHQLITHTILEHQYIPDLETFEVISQDPVENSYVVKLIYNIGPLFTKREFIEKIYIVKDVFDKLGSSSTTDKCAMVISIPYNDHAEKEKNTVRAYYHSIELIKYDSINNKIIWDMITNSNAKGYIPKWAQNLGINKKISQDVPKFLQFVRGNHSHGQ